MAQGWLRGGSGVAKYTLVVHTCSPSNAKHEKEMKQVLNTSSKSAGVVQKNILTDMIRQGSSIEIIQDEADKMLDCTKSGKLKQNTSQQFCNLIATKKYQSTDNFVIYKMNDRNHNGNPTFVFKTSKTALQMGVDIDKESGHFLSECYVNFDGNEKRVTKMSVLTTSVYHPLLKRQCVLATMDCEEENFQNSKMFWNCWNTALPE